MTNLRLSQLFQRLALLGMLVFAAFASVSWGEHCGAASPCGHCTPLSACQTSLAASANPCCALGAANLLPAEQMRQTASGAAVDLPAITPRRMLGRSLAPPLPPPRPV